MHVLGLQDKQCMTYHQILNNNSKIWANRAFMSQNTSTVTSYILKNMFSVLI